MGVHDDLVPVLKKLRRPGVLSSIDPRTEEPTDEGLSHAEFLYRLLHDEVKRRESEQRSLRLCRASFGSNRSLEDFDSHVNPDVPKAEVIDLATCQFIERQSDVLLVGATGLGMSQLALVGVRAVDGAAAALHLFRGRAELVARTPVQGSPRDLDFSSEGAHLVVVTSRGTTVYSPDRLARVGAFEGDWVAARFVGDNLLLGCGASGQLELRTIA